MYSQFIVLIYLFLEGCALPTMFSVSVDEPVKGGTLTLNGRSANLIHNIDGAYWAKWNGSDASGTIRVIFPDGKSTICRIGYVTPGMGIQRFEVLNRRCNQVIGS